jgi:hypothetical protein
MNCTHCGKPVVLVPSATERAQRYGGTPNDYVKLFPIHAQCQLDARKAATSELMARYRERGTPNGLG